MSTEADRREPLTATVVGANAATHHQMDVVAAPSDAPATRFATVTSP